MRIRVRPLRAACLRAIEVAVLLASAARAFAAPSVDPETADEILISEKESWHRALHGALGFPHWLDLGVEQRTRYEALIHPFRPGEPNRQIQYPQRTRLRLQADCSCRLRFLAELQDSRHLAGGRGRKIGS